MSDNKNESSNSNVNQGDAKSSVRVELTKSQKQFDTKPKDGKLSSEQLAKWNKAGGKSLDKLIEAQEKAQREKTKYTKSVEGNTNINTKINEGNPKIIRSLIINQTFQIKNQNIKKEKNFFKKDKLQVCDILNDYKWTLDTSVNLGRAAESPELPKASSVPHCYMVQYTQKLSSNITNFINTIVSAVNTINDESVQKSIKNVAKSVDTLKNGLMKALTNDDNQGQGNGVSNASKFMFSKLQQGVNLLASHTVDKISKKMDNGIMNSKYLAPYKLLYDLKATNQRFVFPMVAQPPINKLVNSYGQKQESDSILSSNSFLNWWDTLASGVVSFGRDLRDFAGLLSGANQQYTLSNIEKAKFFNYPTDTEEYTITFPLLNTVKGNSSIPEWQKNYKFIMLFTLRNMVLRRDNASYYPPLFYDLIIPGVIRQPFCYVKQVNVKPIGLTRMLLAKDVFNFQPLINFSVPVPQAWIVTIKVKSLLSTSANMILSGLTDLKITVGGDYYDEHGVLTNQKYEQLKDY